MPDRGKRGGNAKGKRVPRGATVTTAVDRRPKALAPLIRDDGTPVNPVFSFALADRNFTGTNSYGQWGWPLLTPEASQALTFFMCEISRRPWGQVLTATAGKHKKHHDQPVESICNEAQARLRALQLDDFSENIFRFRLTGTQRLWGFLRVGVFYAVWWDPFHRVYPTEPN